MFETFLKASMCDLLLCNLWSHLNQCGILEVKAFQLFYHLQQEIIINWWCTTASCLAGHYYISSAPHARAMSCWSIHPVITHTSWGFKLIASYRWLSTSFLSLQITAPQKQAHSTLCPATWKNFQHIFPLV
jgi:hypothetical protein